MKLIWQIITSLYSILKKSGINLPPYSFLFNKPKIKFPKTIVETIRADSSFNERERKLIVEAAQDMFRFTNKRIKFNIRFDLEPEECDLESNVIYRICSDEEYIQKADEKYDNYVIGLCNYRENHTKVIYLIYDRLERSDNLFRTTTIHEFGHYLGMQHTTNCSIMQPVNPNTIPYPTYKDAVELAKIWKCLPTDLAYFKL